MPNDPDQNAPGLAGLGEEGLLRRIRDRAPQDHPRLIRGIGDDAAVIAGAERTLVTTDLLIENVHFRRDRSLPRLLGRKLVAVNLSDIAAMGGTPAFAFLTLAAPADFPLADTDEIVAGVIERCAGEKVCLAGGDLSRAGLLFLSLTLMGSAALPAPVYRSGARPGDDLYLTGELGGAALGLQRLHALASPLTAEMLADDEYAGALRRQLDPPARLAAGQALAGRATAMMDLSDGLLTDLPRLLRESGGLGAVIEIDRLPLDPDLRRCRAHPDQPTRDELALVLAGGEDYELLFTAAPGGIAGEVAGLAVTRIGAVRRRPGIELVNRRGEPVPPPPPLFEHFRGPGR